MKPRISETELIFPELSYKIVGVLFSVHNKLGGGLQERIYYKTIKSAFEEANIKYKPQFKVDLNYGDQKISHYFLVFLVEDKIVLEIKSGQRFKIKDIEQVYAYLKSTNLKLGILANFAKKYLKFKRIINLH